MNAFWKDPVRRELIVAAAIGFTWAVLGFALAARGQPPKETSGSLPLVGRVGEGGEVGTRFITLPPTPPHQGEGLGEVLTAGSTTTFPPARPTSAAAR